MLVFNCLLFGFFVRAQSDIPVGQVLESVTCSSDSTQSYSLYLPSQYSKEKNLPILYFFEPAARGSLPVRIFQRAAEKYGLILAASNNARNGSWQRSFDAGNAMFSDTQQKLNVDTDQVFLAGFSGGSRVAASVASLTDQFKGVIACGAGLPYVREYQPKEYQKFVYVGFVGKKDPNFLEMLDLTQSVSLPMQLVITEDGHVWPDEDTALRLVGWLLTMNKLLTQSEKVEFLTTEVNFIMQSDLPENAIYQTKALSMLLNWVDDLNLRSACEVKYDSIVAAKEYKKRLKEWNRVIKNERKEREELIDALTEAGISRLQIQDSTFKTFEWWKLKIGSYRRSLDSKNTYKKNQARRLMETVFVEGIEQSNAYELRGDIALAITLNRVALLAKDSPYPAWNLARLYAIDGQVEMSVELLEDAVNKGLKNKKSLENQAFDVLLEMESFQSIYEQLD